MFGAMLSSSYMQPNQIIELALRSPVSVFLRLLALSLSLNLSQLF